VTVVLGVAVDRIVGRIEARIPVALAHHRGRRGVDDGCVTDTGTGDDEDQPETGRNCRTLQRMHGTCSHPLEGNDGQVPNVEEAISPARFTGR
jgi:hypothetical protein